MDAGKCTIDHQEAPRLHRCGVSSSLDKDSSPRTDTKEAGEVKGTGLNHKASPPNALGGSGGAPSSKLY